MQSKSQIAVVSTKIGGCFLRSHSALLDRPIVNRGLLEETDAGTLEQGYHPLRKNEQGISPTAQDIRECGAAFHGYIKSPSRVVCRSTALRTAPNHHWRFGVNANSERPFLLVRAVVAELIEQHHSLLSESGLGPKLIHEVQHFLSGGVGIPLNESPPLGLECCRPSLAA